MRNPESMMVKYMMVKLRRGRGALRGVEARERLPENLEEVACLLDLAVQSAEVGVGVVSVPIQEIPVREVVARKEPGRILRTEILWGI